MEDGAHTAKQAKQPPKQRSAENSQQAGRADWQQIQPPGDEICPHHDADMPQNHHCLAVSFPSGIDQCQADQAGRTDDRSPEHKQQTQDNQHRPQCDRDVTSLLHGFLLCFWHGSWLGRCCFQPDKGFSAFITVDL